VSGVALEADNKAPTTYTVLLEGALQRRTTGTSIRPEMQRNLVLSHSSEKATPQHTRR